MLKTAPAAVHYRNEVLRHLSPETIERLSLSPVELPVDREMEYPENGIRHLFFVEEGVGSMTITFEDGSEVEVGLFGFESVVGASALMGVKRSLNRIYMQIGGRGFSSPVEAAQKEFRLCGEFHDLLLRYVQAQLTQVAQSAACNAKHTIHQRLARWLLLCADRSGSDSFDLSQEFLATMLGVNRPSVTIAIGQFTDQGLITHRRREIQIVNKPALEAHACECYLTVKQHLEKFTTFDTGFVA